MGYRFVGGFVRAAIFFLLMTLAGAANAVDRACSWIFEPTYDRENILFPEVTTRYLAAIIPAPPGGGYIEVTGKFPHARYMSLQTYTTTLQSISNLPDFKIAPDEGSTNPFRPGADRTTENRSYTIRVLDEQAPKENVPPNTLYYRHPDGIQSGRVLVYRIYVPDDGTDRFGDAPAPSLTIVMPEGTRIPVPECPDIVPDTGFLAALLAASGASDYPLPPVGLFGREQPEWRKYFNAGTGYIDMFTNDEILGPLNGPLRDLALNLPAGLGENADNKYVYTGLSREFGDVVLIRAKKPTTPHTSGGEPRMETGQLRFWSMCIGNRASMVYDCVIDEHLPLDRNDYYSIAISTAANRPANATTECGVAWLPWGPDVITSVIMRNMLPAANFPNSVQAADQGTEKETLGPYYPSITYFASAADFENEVGCHAPSTAGGSSLSPRFGSGGGGSFDLALLLLGLSAVAARRQKAR